MHLVTPQNLSSASISTQSYKYTTTRIGKVTTILTQLNSVLALYSILSKTNQTHITKHSFKMPSATPARTMLRTWARNMTEPHPFARNPVSAKPYPAQYSV
ncbi:uncharacterized protein M421DRAFT_423271, partial [Didymella exigua CBS 183.55]